MAFKVIFDDLLKKIKTSLWEIINCRVVYKAYTKKKVKAKKHEHGVKSSGKHPQPSIAIKRKIPISLNH